MELKPGHKQTEVGVIPEDWLDLQLQQITEEDSPICYGIVQVGSFAENGIPVLAIKNLNLGYSSNIHRAAIEVERPYARSRVRPADVLVSVKGTTGRVGLVPNHFRGNISRDLARIRPRKEIEPSFLYQILQSHLVQRRLAAATVGTTRMELSIAILKQIRVPLPPTKAEQRAIAEALSDADALIKSLEQLLAKKLQIKQGIMQELLTGKKRLPGFNGNWEIRPFEEVLSRVNTRPYKIQTHEYQATGIYPVVDQGKAPIVGFSDLEEKRFDCPDGGVIVFGDHTCIVKFINFDFLVGADGTQILEAKNGQCARFHAFQLQHSGITPTGYNRHFKLLVEREFIVPPLSEQVAIAAIISDMETEIIALEAKLVKAHQIKQSMMQELLTGGIRLV